MSAGTEEVEVLSVRPTPPSQAEETVKTEPLNNVTDISPSLSPEIEDVQHLLSETPVPFSIDRVGAQDNINEDLTPPPDSPVELYEPVEEPTDGNVEDHQHAAMDQTEDASTLEDNMSVVSSPAAVNGLEDEIVVGTKVNSKASPGPGPSDQEDVILEDDGQESYLGLVKRKRSTDDEDDSLLDGEEGSTAPAEDVDQNQSFSHLATVQSTKSSRGVVLGYWRDSQIEDGADKHAVSGFLDRKERLRTKVHYVSRDGRPINSDEYPLPPGPGGSWCTFDKIVFEDHLVGLNQLVVKAYVKLLATDPDFMENGESPADKEEAVRLAQEWVEEHGGPETQQNTIAYGAFIPEHAVTQSKQPASQAVTQPKPVQKRRKVAGPPADPEPAIQPPPPISGTRPTSVVLGYWKGSDVHDSVDKHAVLGILGANEMFRLKISRTTRDGQVVGSFPAGAGALWIQWEDCEFEPHLKRLSRAEIKEYCRIRQLQIDQGESPEERITNELQAKEEARQRVRQQYASGIPAGRSEADKSSSMTRSRFSLANGAQNGHEGTNGALITPQSEEPRQPRQAALKGRHSLPNVEFQAANRSRPASLATEKSQAQAAREATRLNSLALQGMVRIEAKQAKLDQRATNHPSAASGATAADQFGQNIARLQRVWASQEANRIRADGDDSKMHMGVKYERKQTGPFQGKLVSHGSLISIDGEDYVEYRVLMKPTFF